MAEERPRRAGGAAMQAMRWLVGGRKVRFVAIGMAALVASLLVPTGAGAQGSATTFNSSFSTSTHLTEQTVEVDQCSPDVATGSRTLTASSTSDTVTTEEILTSELTVGPDTIIIGDRHPLWFRGTFRPNFARRNVVTLAAATRLDERPCPPRRG